MRLRNVPGAREVMIENEYVFTEPEGMKGTWSQVFGNDNPIRIEIGMGKRTNTILQSAFFRLANVMPIEQAVQYMKEAAKKSYSKKGDAVVEMNYKAIDAGVDALHGSC